MDVPIGAKVHCTDGICGYVTHAIVNPSTKEVTHMVVQEEDPQYRKIIVPLALVSESTPKQVHIRCKLDELSKLESFEEIKFALIEVPEYIGGAYGMLPQEIVETRQIRSHSEHVPPGELALRRGAHVEATDGRVGQVDEFLVDPRDDKITHLVLRKGHLWGKRDVTIPVAEIDRIEEDTIHLKLDKHAVERLPSSPVQRNN
jgi:sporulation protein YlmC with PRC-barrel domain